MERRPGFTMAEILIALAVMAILGGLIVPTLISSVDRARIDAAEESLRNIAEAVDLFADAVGDHPAALTQLVRPIVNPATDICGTDYTVGEENRWSGPYLNRALTGTGLPLGIGVALNAFSVLPDPAGIDYLRVTVQNVLTEDAVAMDRRVDDGDGAAGGALRWTAPAGGVVTVHYLIPFPDC